MRAAKRKEKALPKLDQSAAKPEEFKSFINQLKKRRKAEQSEDSDFEDGEDNQNVRFSESSDEEEGKGYIEIDEETGEAQFVDENDEINSDDDDDDLSTINGSVTTFTPSRSSDPFIAHFGLDLSEEALNDLKFEKFGIDKSHFLSPGFYMQSSLSRFQIPSGKSSFALDDAFNLELYPDLRKMKVKAALVNRLNEINAKHLEKLESNCRPILGMTPTQFETFYVLNNYLDLYCPKWTLENSEELRIVYCLHILNHLLKARKIIALNNNAVKKNKKVDREFRDRGLTRPKVVVLVPFRESASKIVQTFWRLLTDPDNLVVSNRKRFMLEYTVESDPRKPRHFRDVPTDFEQLFAGNCDDNFRIGLSISKRTVKLFTGFYNSDLIIASPLGLRSITPRDNPALKDEKTALKSIASDEEALFDFLSSVEMLIVDQADVLLMQNWDHVVQIMQSMNEMPKQPHDVDFSRVRMWSLNGLTKFYRQTVLFSNVITPELNAFFNRFCCNRNGRVQLSKIVDHGSVNDIVHQSPQLFHRIDGVDNIENAADKRFDYFTSKVLPQIVDNEMKHTLIFVPSYFDYVRLRNHCKRERFNCFWISE